MKQKTAIITGSRGQDASYLAELLLEKGYRVVAVDRRISSPDYCNIKHLMNHPSYKIEDGDVTDFGSMARLINEYKPEEFYNLAAQSFVAASWTQPLSTADANFNGVSNCLEAIRLFSPATKFFQASTSEVYGDVTGSLQNEDTPARPRSPYAAAKFGAESLVKVYRDSYGVFACFARSFNHESIMSNSPVILKGGDGKIDIVPIVDMFKTEGHRYEGLLQEYVGYSVWNSSDWTKIVKGTCYQDKDKKMRLVQTVSACCETTLDHEIFLRDDTDVPNKDLKLGDKLFGVSYPSLGSDAEFDLRLSKFAGFVAGDGCINESGAVTLTGTDLELLRSVASLVNGYGFETKETNAGPGQFDNCTKDVWKIEIRCGKLGLWLRENVYTLRFREKRVPKFVLNGSKETKAAFFEGYYLADGRKAGHEAYKYKGWTTSSATLCLGLIYVFKSLYNQTVKCKTEIRGDERYYYVQLGTDKTNCSNGQHLKKDKDQIVKLEETTNPDGWFFDIQTESQTFATGANLVKVHNSPRRGKEFVTRKITDWIGKSFAIVEQHILAELQKSAKESGQSAVATVEEAFQHCLLSGKIQPLALGNLDSKRDWSHAKDVVAGMWLMLQNDEPDDFVFASGRAVSISDFLDLAFKEIGIENWKPYVTIDAKFFRPADVNYLCGDASKAKRELKWNPNISLEQLVSEMVRNDIQLNRK